MNFIFISPNYPSTYYKFCTHLKKLGFNVLGIGDEVPEKLCGELKSALTDYVSVKNLGDYDTVFSAAKYLSEKFGKANGIESNNESWLANDAMLRRDLGINDGVTPELLEYYQYKSKMKEKFTAAKVATVPFAVGRDLGTAKAFAAKHGFPVFAKPNKCVGARAVCKIDSEEQLAKFCGGGLCEDYIFECYIDGQLYSYDGITDKCGNIVFETAHFFEIPIHKLKSTDNECIYYTLEDIPQELAAAGQAAVRAFELKGRFFHIEFFRLNSPIGKSSKGDFVGIEVNMRPAGGFTPEMINAAKGTDVYEIWAQCMASQSVLPFSPTQNHTCVNIGRHSKKAYKYSVEQIRQRFPDNFIFFGHTSDEENPFGNDEIIGLFKTHRECRDFAAMATELQRPEIFI